MDIEKVEKVAMGLAPRQDKTSLAMRYKFKQGVEWLMQQPLVDRLTEEEKKKALKIHSQNASDICKYDDEVIRAHAEGVMHGIEIMFGRSLFENQLSI